MDILHSTNEIRALLNKILARTRTPYGREAMGKVLEQLETAPRGLVIEVLEVDELVKRILNDYLNKFLTSEDAEIDLGTCEMLSRILNERSVMCAVSVSTDRKAAFKAYKRSHLSLDRKRRKEAFARACEEADRLIDENKAKIAKLTDDTSIYRLTAIRVQRERQLEEAMVAIEELKARYKATGDARTHQRLETEFKTRQNTVKRLNAELATVIDGIFKINAQANAEAQVDTYQEIKEVSTYDAERLRRAAKRVTEANKRNTEEIKEAIDDIEAINRSNDKYMDAASGYYYDDSLAAEVERDRAKNLDVAAADSLEALTAADEGEEVPARLGDET
jgi:hypothetical protein